MKDFTCAAKADYKRLSKIVIDDIMLFPIEKAHVVSVSNFYK